MKTVTETKFDTIVKEGFHGVLKPLGFKKKGNNFYLQLPDLGQIINLQKSSFGSKDHIKFTINTGVFIPEYWLEEFARQSKMVPVFPTEVECLIRKRIGEMRYGLDTWFDVTDTTDEIALIAEMKKNVTDYILPYFNDLNSKQKIVTYFEKDDLHIGRLSKLIILAKYGEQEKAKDLYESLLQTEKRPYHLEEIKEYGTKFGL